YMVNDILECAFEFLTVCRYATAAPRILDHLVRQPTEPAVERLHRLDRAFLRALDPVDQTADQVGQRVEIDLRLHDSRHRGLRLAVGEPADLAGELVQALVHVGHMARWFIAPGGTVRRPVVRLRRQIVGIEEYGVQPLSQGHAGAARGDLGRFAGLRFHTLDAPGNRGFHSLPQLLRQAALAHSSSPGPEDLSNRYLCARSESADIDLPSTCSFMVNITLTPAQIVDAAFGRRCRWPRGW